MEKQQSHKHQKSSIEELFGNILKQLRNEKGISQEQLGFESGYHRTYISMLERGKKSPSLKTIFQLSKALDVNPSVIIEKLQALDNGFSGKESQRGSVKK